MKIHSFLSTTTAAAVLACTAGAQQLFGPWVHNSSTTQLSLFASPTGGGNGSSPSSPLDLNTAVTQADLFFGANWANTHKGVTINLLPGTYNLAQPLSLPAFGFSIEPFFGATAGSVTFTGSAQSLFYFDHDIGFFTQLIVGSSAGMPPSVVRGLTFVSNNLGAAIEIDPSVGTNADTTALIEVEVTQCQLNGCSTGIRIRNSLAYPLEYRNVIVDNSISGCFIGIDAVNAWFESDLIRSNRISGATNWMSFDGSQASPGMMHPRILSNMMSNASNTREGLFLRSCSARVVNNSMAFVTNTSANPAATPETIHIDTTVGGSGGAGEAIVIENNILFSPTFVLPSLVTVDPPEIRISGGFAGTLTIDSNDFDSSGTGTLITPAQTVGPNNVAIASAGFVSPTTPVDLHLTASSPSLTNPGNMAFVLPGSTATVKVNSQSIPANCALDVDLDPRTHMNSVSMTEVLHRGADQFIETKAKLRTATTGPNLQADFFGNVKVAAGTGDAVVDLLLDLPVGSSFSIVLGAALPMGPELQHLHVAPFGSIAIDPTPGNGVTLVSGITTVNPQPVPIHLGNVTPALNEAEMYLQAIFVLQNGAAAPMNRLRLDIDDL